MFVDSSAFVAMMTGEGDAEQLTARLERARKPVTSSIVAFETVLALSRIHGAPKEQAQVLFLEFVKTARIEVVPIGPEVHLLALNAHQLYGKGGAIMRNSTWATVFPTPWQNRPVANSSTRGRISVTRILGDLHPCPKRPNPSVTGHEVFPTTG